MKILGSNALPHWNRTSATVPDCNYEVLPTSNPVVEQIDKDILFRLLSVRATNCKAGWEYRGGSSFKLITRGFCLGSCKIFDNFDDTYDINCTPCKSQKKMTFPRRECRNVSITLDYEHFDAYSERAAYYGQWYQPLRYPIVHNTLYCIHLSSASSVALDMYSSPNDPENSAISVIEGDYVNHARVSFKYNHAFYGNDSILRDGDVTTGSWVRVHPHSSAPAQLTVTSPAISEDKLSGGIVNNEAFLRTTVINNYELDGTLGFGGHQHVWRWDNAVDTVPFPVCVSRKAIYMVGESHLRYLWDALIVDAWNETDFLRALDSHHRDYCYAGRVSYKQAFFAGYINGHIDFLCADITADLSRGASPTRYTYELRFTYKYIKNTYAQAYPLQHCLQTIRLLY